MELLFHIHYLKTLDNQQVKKLVEIAVYIRIDVSFAESLLRLVLKIITFAINGDKDTLKDKAYVILTLYGKVSG